MGSGSRTAEVWNFVPLGSVCNIRRGAPITKKEVANGEVPVVAGGIGPAYFHNRANRTGNVITVSGSGANAGFVNFYDRPIWASDCSTIEVSTDSLSIDFVYKFLLSAQEFINSNLRHGAAQPHVYPKDLARIEIPLPSLDEQRRIVAVLDQAFAALDRARANAEANLADGEALFERVLLTTFDELMPTASMKTLAEAAKDFSRGKSKHRPRNDPALYGGEYPFIQTGDVRKAQGSIREFSQTYNAVGLAQSKLWPVGTVCITIAANIAETGVLEVEACFPDSVIGMVPRPGEVTPYYVEYMLRYFSRELKLKGKGSAQDNINLATFEAAEFPFPPLEQQQTIVEKLDGLATQLATLRANYTRAVSDITTLRRSLLQVAFSGQLG